MILKTFSLFSEYFLAIALIYTIIVGTLLFFSTKTNTFIISGLSQCILLLFFLTFYLLTSDNLISNLPVFCCNKAFLKDPLALYGKILICLFFIFYIILTLDSLIEQNLNSFEYFIILLFSVLGLLLLCSGFDLLIIYICIELSGLSCYVLAAFNTNSRYSVDAGLKYFITGSLSSAFFLFGSSLLYFSSGSINFEHFYILFTLEPYYWFNWELDYFLATYNFFFAWENKQIVLQELTELISILLPLRDLEIYQLIWKSIIIDYGILFILCGLSIKLALAPFHMWSLDIYESSPTNSSIFFAVFLKISLFIIIIRFCYTCFYPNKKIWGLYFLVIGLLSIFIGSFGGVTQKRLKTLLAYSSISHMGYLLLPLSTGSYFSIEVFIFYISIYMLTSLCAWSVLLFLRIKNNKISYKYSKELGDLSGLGVTHKGFSFLWAILLLSLAGIPPLIGFVSKLVVFFILIKNNYFFSILSILLFSVISTFYYIRILKVIYFENTLVGKLYYPIKIKKTLLLTCLIFILILLFFNPTGLYLISHSIALNLPDCFPFLHIGNITDKQVFVYPLCAMDTLDTLTNIINLYNNNKPLDVNGNYIPIILPK